MASKNVKVVHVYHDEQFERVEIFTSTGYSSGVLLTCIKEVESVNDLAALLIEELVRFYAKSKKSH